MAKTPSKTKLKILDLILAVGLMATSITFLVIFYKALVVNANGRVLIDINSYNEGWAEVSMFVIFLASAVYKFKLICDE